MGDSIYEGIIYDPMQEWTYTFHKMGVDEMKRQLGAKEYGVKLFL